MNNEKYCDLHLHSYYSDGTLSPSEVVGKAKSLGISPIALTDHNTVKGLDEFIAAAKAQGIDAIPGIEFSVDYRGKELHLVGLGIDKKYFAEIEEKMDEYLKIREQSNRAMVEALCSAGYLIDYDEIYKKSGNGYVNRAHIGAALVEKGYCSTVREAFATLLSKDGPYFRPRIYPRVFDIIDYIDKIGAVSILAHPFLQFNEEELREFLREAKKHGLDGMETVYTEFSDEQTACLAAVAKEFDLLESGGSDFHGATKPDVAFGVGLGNLRVPASFAETIKNSIGETSMLKKEEIRIRDPFIYTDKEEGCYYMYGTTSILPNTLAARCNFSCYKTYDFENFEGPFVLFDAEKEDFWADRDFWAAELHKYNGRYYLFGSCKAEDKCRGTQIFVCDTPNGHFVPLTKEPVTPRDWECLDGTLYVENGQPYMVFCHEWVQVKIGEIWAIPLSEDLSSPIGEPKMLFRAIDNPDVSELRAGRGTYVTDGPFLWNEDGKVKMIWSSFYKGRYLVLEAEADSLFGEWRHGGSRFDFDGGHAMVFTTLEGKRMIALHKPNKANLERAFFCEF